MYPSPLESHTFEIVPVVIARHGVTYSEVVLHSGGHANDQRSYGRVDLEVGGDREPVDVHPTTGKHVDLVELQLVMSHGRLCVTA